MAERGAALIEILIVTAISAVIWAMAIGVIAELPAGNAAWDEAAAARQAVRAIEARLARLTAAAVPIEVDVGGSVVRVPAVWPRRLGLLRPGAAGDVSREAVTIVSRADGHRAVSLASALPAGGGSVAFEARAGCGSAPACGLRAGDVVLAIDGAGVCAVFRVIAAGARLELEPLMPGAGFGPGSAIVPVTIDVIAFDAAESALRRYDGYRSDNVVADGVAGLAIVHRAPGLGDGPFVGEGPMAFDVDQLSIAAIEIELTMAGSAGASESRLQFAWRLGLWP